VKRVIIEVVAEVEDAVTDVDVINAVDVALDDARPLHAPAVMSVQLVPQDEEEV
jgi:hypothetical protein